MLVTVYDELDYSEADPTVSHILDEGVCSQDQINMLTGVFDDESRDPVLTPQYATKLSCMLSCFTKYITVSRAIWGWNKPTSGSTS
jgi:hypothetical protein